MPKVEPPRQAIQATLAMMSAMGPRELVNPPPQRILPGAQSYMNYPFALVPGYRMLRLDLHVPDGAKGPVPVVIYASGGAWQLVIKHHGPWKFLLSEGYAVASIEYRLSGEAVFPAGIHDVKAAVRWLRANAEQFGLDDSRIAAWGSSAGAYLTSMAAATNGSPEFEGRVGDHLDRSSAIACAIDHYGPSDLASVAEDTNSIPGVVEAAGTATSPETLFLGYPPAEKPAEAQRTNVATYVSSSTVPFLIMHGDADTRVGIGQSRRLYEALRRVGADVDFHVLPGANHAGPEFDTPQAHQLALNFLNRALRRDAFGKTANSQEVRECV